MSRRTNYAFIFKVIWMKIHFPIYILQFVTDIVDLATNTLKQNSKKLDIGTAGLVGMEVRSFYVA